MNRRGFLGALFGAVAASVAAMAAKPTAAKPKTFLAIITDKLPPESVFFSCEEALQDRLATYSWVEAEVTEDGIRPKPDGRFGVAGETDAATEINRQNANIHLNKMAVTMHHESKHQFWFDLEIPREPALCKFIISSAASAA